MICRKSYGIVTFSRKKSGPAAGRGNRRKLELVTLVEKNILRSPGCPLQREESESFVKSTFFIRRTLRRTKGRFWKSIRFKGTKRASQQLPITPHGAPTARDGNNSSYWEGRIDLPSFDSRPAYRRAGFMPAGGRAQSQVHARNFRV